jgi:hypothetical protein
MTARDEDVIAFTPASLGHATTGTFSLWFDGSDVGLAETGEDIDAVAIDASGLLYLSGADPVAVTGVTAQDEDVFVFSPTALDPPTTAGSFTTVPYFDGSAFGLGANDVSGFDVPGI